MASEAKKPRIEQNGDHVSDEIIEKIDDIQSELDKINESASVEILAVEKTFSKKRQPFYKERSELIKKIPLFWSTALRNHPAISSLITQSDGQALTYLEQLEVEEFDDIKSGFKITLTFNENPYFTNKQLCKSVYVGDQELSTVSDSIDWKEGQNYVVTLLEEFKGLQKKSSVNGNMAVPSSSDDNAQVISFIQWFAKNEKQPQDSTIELGEVIKDDLWPNPLQYYFASESYEDDDEDDDEDEDDEENDDEEDIEEELEGDDGDDK